MDRRDDASPDAPRPSSVAVPVPAAPPEGALLDELGLQALRTLEGALAALRSRLPLAVRQGLPPDLVAQDEPATRALARLTRRLAAALVEDTVRGGSGDSLRPAVADLGAALDATDVTLAEARPHLPSARAALGELVREVALDELGADITFDATPAGSWGGVWTVLPPRAVDAALVQRVLWRLYAWVARDPLAELELRAGAWGFAGFGGPRDEGVPAEVAARTTRELEWQLLDRKPLALGRTAAEAFLARTRRGDTVPRQRALVRALARSFAGLFSVRRRHGEDVELERLDGGGRYRMIEYNDRMEYDLGDLAVGRLIPMEGARYLRSPGLAIWRPRDAGAARQLAERAEAFIAQGMAPALAAEASLRTFFGAKVVPHYGPAAATAAEARALLDTLWQRVRAAGIGEVLAPEETGRRLPEGLEARRVPGDAVLFMWVQALKREAGGASAASP